MQCWTVAEALHGQESGYLEETMLNEGMKAPEFCLSGIDEAGNEKEFCLSGLLKEKKKIVLYFYPKDNTPGCTTEACDFRDSFNRIGKKAVVIGISRDSISSHRNFREKYGLNFPLLSDPDQKVLEAYDAWGEKIMYGKATTGTIRTTYIIDTDGKIAKKWSSVKVKGHIDEVMEAL